MDRSRTSGTHSYDPMARREVAGRQTTNDAQKNDKKRTTAKRLCGKMAADLAKLRAQKGRISRPYLDALSSLARNVKSFSSLSRCSSKKSGTSALESNNSIFGESYLCLQQAEESKTFGLHLKACSPFSQLKHCTTRLSTTTKAFRKSNKRSYVTATPSGDAMYPKPKRAKMELDKPLTQNLFTLLTSMHTVLRQIRTQLVVIAKKKKTWMKAKEIVARFDEGLWKVLALDLSMKERDDERTKESERMDQIRPFLKKATEALEEDMRQVLDKLNGMNKDMRHAVEELKGATKDVRHVVEELKDLSNDIRYVISELFKMNQCMNFVPIYAELKEMTKDRRLVSTELTVTEREMILAVDLGTAESRSKSAGSLGLATPRSKATGCRDDFLPRERRLNAMRKALEQASVGGPRIRYAAVWTELDEMWHKLMAHEREKSFAKKAGCARKVSDKPMERFDAHVDKLESWISVL